MKVKKAVIPAAGLGTRFLPATKAMPKEMLPIVDKPTIQYIIEEAVASGIDQSVNVSGRVKGLIDQVAAMLPGAAPAIQAPAATTPEAELSGYNLGAPAIRPQVAPNVDDVDLVLLSSRGYPVS